MIKQKRSRIVSLSEGEKRLGILQTEMINDKISNLSHALMILMNCSDMFMQHWNMNILSYTPWICVLGWKVHQYQRQALYLLAQEPQKITRLACLDTYFYLWNIHQLNIDVMWNIFVSWIKVIKPQYYCARLILSCNLNLIWTEVKLIKCCTMYALTN